MFILVPKISIYIVDNCLIMFNIVFKISKRVYYDDP